MIDRRNVLLASAALAACSAATSDTMKTKPDRADLLSGYAVNIESWYADTPFEQRFDRAARDGFSHVEFWFIDSWKRDAVALARLASDAGVRISQIVGDAPGLARSDVRDTFLENCKRAVANAHTLGTDIITITGHQDVDGISKPDALATYADHLAAAAPIFANAGCIAAIEPFNPYDHPGHFVYGSSDAVAMVEAIGSPAVRLNWDLFHMARAEGELIGNLRRGHDAVAYIQIADAPDRGQPGTGEVNWANVLREVRSLGYDRPVGLELWAKDKDYAQAVEDMLALEAAVRG